METGRCRIHGGKTPSGPASPHWKTGKHSRVLRDLGLSERYDALRTHPELAELRDELALAGLAVDQAIADALGKDRTPEGGAKLLAALEQHRKLVDWSQQQ